MSVGYLHKIVEPGGRGTHVLYTNSDENPWCHWVLSYFDQCEYSCTALVSAEEYERVVGERDFFKKMMMRAAAERDELIRHMHGAS